ncbi:hypothetical protein E4U54_004296 [Claviceps lovelessii]|nr:hypothetical protein E4U54_004296 [Claviceps lovelessii]
MEASKVDPIRTWKSEPWAPHRLSVSDKAARNNGWGSRVWRLGLVPPRSGAEAPTAHMHAAWIQCFYIWYQT